MNNPKNSYFTFSLVMLLALVFYKCRTKKETAYKNFTYNEKYLFNTNLKKQQSNILYLLDGKKISSVIMGEINPDSVSSMHVIKDAEKIKTYTQEQYNSILLIHLKKQ